MRNVKIIVVDCETTGIGDQHQAVELAVITIQGGKQNYWHSLVQPTVPVTIGARAAHHISDKELAGAPPMAKLPLENLFKADVFVAHNAKFDLDILKQSGVPPDLLPKHTICTYRCALHLWPEAESHSNQVLRYHLGINVKFPKDMLPHRALPDAIVTTAIFEKALKMHNVAKLIELSTKPALLQRVGFGQYYGKPWEEIAKTDPSYLRWVLTKDFNDNVMYTAQHWLKAAS